MTPVPDDTTTLAGGVGELPDPGPYVLVCEPGQAARRVALPRTGELVVGRGADCTLRLDDSSASRRHAMVAVSGDGDVRIVDLRSHNGVLVNGARVTGEQILRARDLIAIGRTAMVYHPASLGSAATEASPDRGAAPVITLHLAGQSVIVGDPRMHAIYERVRQLAPQPLTVVISGETGTGKELIARALHAWSPRAALPFVALNCAALPEGLAESELFGHDKGAFSGAIAARAGVLEAAGRGTLFLDEIAELSLANQGRLLRALDLRRVTRLGSVQERPIELRLVAAANRDLEAEVRAGRFRSDLFFRLGGATIELPPLRERRAELPALAQALLAAACARLGQPARQLSPRALAALLRYAWPGNVRELGHLVDLLAASPMPAAPARDVTLDDLPPRFRGATPPATPSVAPGTSLDAELRDLERARIADALTRTGGNQTRAAALIGMPRRTFVAKLRQYRLRGTAG
ncbi:MAG TPA: sigma 54-interacting transcriptional regulator [Kofleriaceae bacterium]